MIREKLIESGPMYEAEFYPVYSDGRRKPERAPKTQLSSKAQQKLNDKNAQKKFVRIINTNFGIGDIVIHGTYGDDEIPASEEECRRDIQNYIRRLKRYRKRMGLCEIKYVYVIESKFSKRTGKIRYHFHMIINKMDRDAAEMLWGYGNWTNANRLQPNEKGLEALGKYLTKSPKGSKRWSASKNLDKPIEKKPRDGKVSSRYLHTLATKRIDDKAYWENRYKGYRFIEAKADFNEFNGYWYLSVTMAKLGTEVLRM